MKNRRESGRNSNDLMRESRAIGRASDFDGLKESAKMR